MSVPVRAIFRDYHDNFRIIIFIYINFFRLVLILAEIRWQLLQSVHSRDVAGSRLKKIPVPVSIAENANLHRRIFKVFPFLPLFQAPCSRCCRAPLSRATSYQLRPEGQCSVIMQKWRPIRYSNRNYFIIDLPPQSNSALIAGRGYCIFSFVCRIFFPERFIS